VVLLLSAVLPEAFVGTAPLRRWFPGPPSRFSIESIPTESFGKRGVGSSSQKAVTRLTASFVVASWGCGWGALSLCALSFRWRFLLIRWADRVVPSEDFVVVLVVASVVVLVAALVVPLSSLSLLCWLFDGTLQWRAHNLDGRSVNDMHAVFVIHALQNSNGGELHSGSRPKRPPPPPRAWSAMRAWRSEAAFRP